MKLSYAEPIPYATPGFIASGIGAIPAGWLADKWSREGMMMVFFLGIGTSSILAVIVNTPLQMAIFLTSIGMFAAIYHPVGLAMVVERFVKTGLPIAIYGICTAIGCLDTRYVGVQHFVWRSFRRIAGSARLWIRPIHGLCCRVLALSLLLGPH